MAIIDCNECGERISDKATTCVHCGVPHITKAAENTDGKDGIEKFAGYGEATGSFFFCVWFSMVIGYALLVNLVGVELLGLEYINEKLFFFYLTLFFSFWLVYFLSKKPSSNSKQKDSKYKQIKTFRRLVGETSLHWEELTEEEKDTKQGWLSNSYLRKADTSMQVMAILIAVSVLILDQVSTIYTTVESIRTCISTIRITVLTFSGIFAFI